MAWVQCDEHFNWHVCVAEGGGDEPRYIQNKNRQRLSAFRVPNSLSMLILDVAKIH